MGRKFCVLLLSMLVVMFAFSAAFAATSYTLAFTEEDDPESIAIQDTDSLQDFLDTQFEDSKDDDNDEYAFETMEGAYYTRKFILPSDECAVLLNENDEVEDTLYYGNTKLGTISWDLIASDDSEAWLNWSVVSEDGQQVLYLNGLAPAYSDDIDNEYYFKVTATTVAINDMFGYAGITNSFDIMIEVEEDDEHALITPEGIYADFFNEYVTSNNDDIKTVTKDYSVTVTATEVPSGRTTRYIAYISDDIEIPDWLTCEKTKDDDGITSITITFNSDASVEAGDMAAVRIPLIVDEDDKEDFADWISDFLPDDYKEDYYDEDWIPVFVWPVTYDGSNTSIVLASDDISFDMTYGDKSDSLTINYTGSIPISWDLKRNDDSSDIAADSIDIDITDITYSDDEEGGTITITVIPSAAGYYTGVMTIVASDDSSADLAITVSVDPQLTLSQNTLAISAKISEDASESVTYFNGFAGSAIVDYEVTPEVPASFDLEPEFSSADGTITFTIHTASFDTSFDETYTYIFSDDYGTSAELVLKLSATLDETTDNNNTTESEDVSELTIEAELSSVPVYAGEDTTLTIYSYNGSGDISWKYEITDGSGIEVSLSSETGEEIDVTIAAAEDAVNSTVLITATDTSGASADVTLEIVIEHRQVTPEDPNENNGGNDEPVTPDDPNNGNNNGNNGNNNNNNENNGNDNNNTVVNEIVSPIFAVDEVIFQGNARSALGMAGTVFTDPPTVTNVTSDSDLAGVPNSDPYVTLPVLQPSGTGIYIFNVSGYLDEIQPGDIIRAYMTSFVIVRKSEADGNPDAMIMADADGNEHYVVPDTSEVSAADAPAEVVLVDSEGNEAIRMPEDGIVNMAAYMEEGKLYASAISYRIDGGGPGDPSGGCEAGFGALALMFAAPLFFRKKK